MSYKLASGQSINLNKSQLMYSASVSSAEKVQISSILGVGASLNLGKYLGLPSMIDRSKKEVFAFIKNRVWKRLHAWNQKFLWRAGKEISLKTVAQALLNYKMGDFFPFLSMLNWKGWWIFFLGGSRRSGARGINWMSWRRLCQAKNSGGLGFKSFVFFQYCYAW